MHSSISLIAMLSIPYSNGWPAGVALRRVALRPGVRRAATLHATSQEPLAFSAEETAALVEASSSTVKAWEGESCPPELRNMMSMPEKFYCLLRNPKVTEVDPVVWTAVRKQWPILMDKTDSALQEALVPIRSLASEQRKLSARSDPRPARSSHPQGGPGGLQTARAELESVRKALSQEVKAPIHAQHQLGRVRSPRPHLAGVYYCHNMSYCQSPVTSVRVTR